MRGAFRMPILFNIESASTFRKRLFGVGHKPAWQRFDAFFLPGCRLVHTFALGEAIDVVFATPQGRIRLVVHRLQPWRIAGCLSWAGRRFSAEPLDAWELPAGRCAVLSLVPGDHIRRLFDVAHPSIGMTGRA
jgi:uncharacterized membrane protein (UPF0127 family)